MEKEFVYVPENVCSRELHIFYDGDTVTNFYSVGGCNGNLQGIGKLISGMKMDEIIDRLSGIQCRGSRTRTDSCPNQIAKALIKLKSENR